MPRLRSTRSWEGLRQRWSAPDSIGVGVTDLSNLAIPAVIVGHDGADDAGANLFSLRVSAGAGLFSHLFLRVTASLWITSLYAWDFPGAANVYAGVRATPLGPLGASNQLQLLPNAPQLTWGVTQTAVAIDPLVSALLPPAQWIPLPEPGVLLAPAGERSQLGAQDQSLQLEIGIDQANTQFSVAVGFRS